MDSPHKLWNILDNLVEYRKNIDAINQEHNLAHLTQILRVLTYRSTHNARNHTSL